MISSSYLFKVSEDESFVRFGVSFDRDDLIVSHHIPKLSVQLEVVNVHDLLPDEGEVVLRHVKHPSDPHFLIVFAQQRMVYI